MWPKCGAARPPLGLRTVPNVATYCVIVWERAVFPDAAQKARIFRAWVLTVRRQRAYIPIHTARRPLTARLRAFEAPH